MLKHLFHVFQSSNISKCTNINWLNVHLEVVQAAVVFPPCSSAVNNVLPTFDSPLTIKKNRVVFQEFSSGGLLSSGNLDL